MGEGTEGCSANISKIWKQGYVRIGMGGSGQVMREKGGIELPTFTQMIMIQQYYDGTATTANSWNLSKVMAFLGKQHLYKGFS